MSSFNNYQLMAVLVLWILLLTSSRDYLEINPKRHISFIKISAYIYPNDDGAFNNKRIHNTLITPKILKLFINIFINVHILWIVSKISEQFVGVRIQIRSYAASRFRIRSFLLGSFPESVYCQLHPYDIIETVSLSCVLPINWYLEQEVWSDSDYMFL